MAYKVLVFGASETKDALRDYVERETGERPPVDAFRPSTVAPGAWEILTGTLSASAEEKLIDLSLH